MKNNYEILGPITIIFCKMPEKLGGTLVEVKISTDKLELVQAWPGTWYIRQLYTDEVFVQGSKVITLLDGYTSIQPQLCRVIAETPPGSSIIYNDNDPFNCTTENLVNIKLGWNYDDSEKQPVRGVYWRSNKNRWEVKLFYQSRRYYLGVWIREQLEEANAAVNEFKTIGPKEYFNLHPKRELNYYKDFKED